MTYIHKILSTKTTDLPSLSNQKLCAICSFDHGDIRPLIYMGNADECVNGDRAVSKTNMMVGYIA